MCAQRAGETTGTTGTLVRVLGERRHHQRCHFPGDSFYYERWRWCLAVHLHHRRLIAAEGSAPREQAIGNHTEAVDISARVKTLAATLLWRHVERRSQNRTDSRE